MDSRLKEGMSIEKDKELCLCYFAGTGVHPVGQARTSG